MNLLSKIKGKVNGAIVGGVVNKVAASEPRTTIAGAALAGLIAANIDYNKLLQGDHQQIATAIAAVIVAVLGYYTNHSGVTSPPSPPSK